MGSGMGIWQLFKFPRIASPTGNPIHMATIFPNYNTTSSTVAEGDNLPCAVEYIVFHISIPKQITATHTRCSR